jgi:hypothetical protein
VGKIVVTISEVFNLSTVCWHKFAVSPIITRTLKKLHFFFFLHLMHCFSVVMKSGCSTLKAVFPGFLPQRSGFDSRAVYVG